MKTHYRQMLACGAAGTLLTFVAAAVLAPSLGTADAVGELVGRFLAAVWIAAGLCAIAAARSPQSWSWPKFIGIYTLGFFALLVVAASGHQTNRDARPAMQVQWPSGWTGEHLPGLSSTVTNEALGFRESGKQTDAKAPRGFIEVSCRYIPWTGESDAEHLDGLLSGLLKLYKDKGYAVSTTPSVPARVGAYPALTATLEYTHDDVDMLQTFTVAQNAKCLIDVMLTAKRANYAAHAATYEAVKAAVR